MPARIYPRAQWTVVAAGALAFASAIRYPGGTVLSRDTAHYSISQNFLSDLGMTAAWNHAPNRLGAALFVASLLLLVVGLGMCVFSVVRMLAGTRGSRRWTKAAGAFAFLSCAAFTGVAVTPENRVMAAHVAFTFWGWRMVALATASLAVAAHHCALLRSRATIALWIGAGLLAAYAALMAWGPTLGDATGLAIQVIAQKVATLILIVVLLLLTAEADRARNRLDSESSI